MKSQHRVPEMEPELLEMYLKATGESTLSNRNRFRKRLFSWRNVLPSVNINPETGKPFFTVEQIIVFAPDQYDVINKTKEATIFL